MVIAILMSATPGLDLELPQDKTNGRTDAEKRHNSKKKENVNKVKNPTDNVDDIYGHLALT